MKKLDYNGIQKEIHRNYCELKDGTLDEMWGERTDENPYLDMLFGMLEINGIELH